MVIAKVSYQRLDLFCMGCLKETRFVWSIEANQRLCEICQSKEAELIADGYLRSNLNIVREEFLKKKYYWLNIIIGFMGMGKSTLGIGVGKYIDPTLNEHRVVTKNDELLKCLKGIEPNQAMQIDEGALQLMSRDAMATANKQLIKILSIIRVKRNFINIVIPSLTLLDSQIKYNMVCSVMRVYQRGKFEFYSRKRAIQLAFWSEKDKLNPFGHVTPNFRGRFNDVNPFRKEYEKKKFQDIQAFIKNVMDDGKSDFYTLEQMANYFKVNRVTPYDWVKQGLIRAVVGAGKNNKQVYLVHKDEVERFKKEYTEKMGYDPALGVSETYVTSIKKKTPPEPLK